jgi:hypothetical protein
MNGTVLECSNITKPPASCQGGKEYSEMFRDLCVTILTHFVFHCISNLDILRGAILLQCMTSQQPFCKGMSWASSNAVAPPSPLVLRSTVVYCLRLLTVNNTKYPVICYCISYKLVQQLIVCIGWNCENVVMIWIGHY